MTATIEDSKLCVSKVKVLKSQNWKPLDATDYVKKKQELNSSSKYEFKEIDCKTAGKKFFYKEKTVLQPIKYTCTNNQCVTGTTGYDTLAECQAACNSNNNNNNNNNRQPGTTYRNCTGEVTPIGKNCKDPGATRGNPDPNGLIYKVQKCLGNTRFTGLDGFFGRNTEAALEVKFGRKNFMPNEVSAICKEYDQAQEPKKDEPKVLTPEEQEKYWEDLVDRGGITSLGKIYEDELYGVGYVIKTNLGDLKSRLQIESDPYEWDPKLFNYFFLKAVSPGQTKGSLYKLIIDKNADNMDEKVWEVDGKWEPKQQRSGIRESIDTKIKNTLKKILKEQNLYSSSAKIEKINNLPLDGKPSDGSPSGSQTVVGDKDLAAQVKKDQDQASQVKKDDQKLTGSVEENCKRWLTRYLYFGIGMAPGGAAATPPSVLKLNICECEKRDKYTDIELSADDFKQVGDINKRFLGYDFLNKKLKYREIKKLVQDGKVGLFDKFELLPGYKMPGFGTNCISTGHQLPEIAPMEESLKETVKTNIKEAINKKKTLTESIVNRITRKIG